LEKGQRLKFSNAKIVASGPLRASVVTDVEYGKSKITTTVSITPTSGSHLLIDAGTRSRLTRLKVRVSFRSTARDLNVICPDLADLFNQLTFSAEVDWHERHEFLKCERPITVGTCIQLARTNQAQLSYRSTSTVTWRLTRRRGGTSNVQRTRTRRGTQPSSKSVGTRCVLYHIRGSSGLLYVLCRA
jgi:alpha-mannosidase